MDWQFPTASLPSLVAGLFQVALAILLLRVGRGRRAALALALLLAAGAGSSILVFVFDGFAHTYPTAVAIALTQPFWTVHAWLWACFAMMLLAERTRVPAVLQAFPTYLVPALGLAVVGLWKPELVWDYSAFLSAPLVEDAPPDAFPFQHPQALSLVLRVIGLATPSLALLLAWWALRREESEQWSSILVIALAAAGTGAFAVGNSAEWIIHEPRSPVLAGVRLVTSVAGLLIVAFFGLLLHDGLRGPAERRGLARGGAALVLGMGILGLWIVPTPSRPLLFSTFLALAMLTFPTLATYALLRHRLLGLDVKLRFAISRSTIAAVFITAFFVASEGAQILFGQGNEWVGLFAAGALVFAVAPLQRAAERLAERAVPSPSDSARSSLPSVAAAVPVVEAPRGAEAHPHADAYALAVRAAMATGAVSPEVDRHLADLADKLGIRAGEALRLRQAVEQEVVG